MGRMNLLVVVKIFVVELNVTWGTPSMVTTECPCQTPFRSSVLYGEPFQLPAIGKSPLTPSAKTVSAKPVLLEFVK